MTPVTVHGLTIEQWTATVMDMQRELQWIRSQRHLRADEHHKQLQQLWEGSTRPQREAITELLMLYFCNMHVAKTVQPTEDNDVQKVNA